MDLCREMRDASLWCRVEPVFWNDQLQSVEGFLQGLVSQTDAIMHGEKHTRITRGLRSLTVSFQGPCMYGLVNIVIYLDGYMMVHVCHIMSQLYGVPGYSNQSHTFR